MIDFGVAKAIDQSLTEKTLFTQFGPIIGTLEYMSPEQAEMGPSMSTPAATLFTGRLALRVAHGLDSAGTARLREVAYAEICAGSARKSRRSRARG